MMKELNAKSRWRILVVGILALISVVILGTVYLFLPNEIGLTRFDLFMGGRPSTRTLRANTLAVADSFLQTHTNLYDNSYQPVVDYSKCSKIRALGYRSSFYYFCWDIYLPYSLRAPSGEGGTIIVQLSDAVQGNRHDLQKFQVIRAILADDQGRVTKTVNVP
jgi:hypothetical protein